MDNKIKVFVHIEGFDTTPDLTPFVMVEFDAVPMVNDIVWLDDDIMEELQRQVVEQNIPWQWMRYIYGIEASDIHTKEEFANHLSFEDVMYVSWRLFNACNEGDLEKGIHIFMSADKNE